MSIYDPALGEILVSPYNFAPRGWAFCHGQLLAISQNAALFSLLGTNFGGDGRATFGLPDLRGRVVVGAGLGAGLSDYQLGQRGGAEGGTLNVRQLMPGDGEAVAVVSGDSPEVSVMQPYLALNYIISLQGVYPSRS